MLGLKTGAVQQVSQLRREGAARWGCHPAKNRKGAIQVVQMKILCQLQSIWSVESHFYSTSLCAWWYIHVTETTKSETVFQTRELSHLPHVVRLNQNQKLFLFWGREVRTTNKHKCLNSVCLPLCYTHAHCLTENLILKADILGCPGMFAGIWAWSGNDITLLNYSSV